MIGYSQAVDSIPGASLIKEEPKDGKTEDPGRRVTSDEIKVDINLANHDEDPDNALLSTDKKDKVKERQNFVCIFFDIVNSIDIFIFLHCIS